MMNNQYTDFMKSMMSGEFCKNMGKVDLSNFSDSAKKSVENMFALHKIFAENFQTMSQKAEKTFELCKTTSANSMNSFQEALKSGDTVQLQECHKKCIKSLLEMNLNNFSSFTQMYADTMKKLLDAMDDNVHEIKNKPTDKK